jgi:hypothetical protein
MRQRREQRPERLHAAGGTRNGDEPRILVARIRRRMEGVRDFTQSIPRAIVATFGVERNQPPISSRTASRSDQAIRLV